MVTITTLSSPYSAQDSGLSESQMCCACCVNLMDYLVESLIEDFMGSSRFGSAFRYAHLLQMRVISASGVSARRRPLEILIEEIIGFGTMLADVSRAK